MDAAEARFRVKVARQSTTLEAAVVKYRKRYRRAPPRGFDKWYAFAIKNHFVMIDEFDSVVEDLAPFWELSGAEVQRRAALVVALPSIDLVRVRNGTVRTVNLAKGWEDDEVSARAEGFRRMLTKFVAELPDVDFPINAKAEGRVIVPWEHVNYPNLTQEVDASADWAGAGSVWDAWRRTCPPTSPARRLYSSIGAGRISQAILPVTKIRRQRAGVWGSEFEFALKTGADMDFCTAPAAHYEQGHFFSDWRILPALAPVFSPARARGFRDIRIPSHYYYGGTRRYTYAWDPIKLEQRAVDPMEVPWEEKRDVVWWRGASTGGGSSPPGFGAGYQRHRSVPLPDTSVNARPSLISSPPEEVAHSDPAAYTTVPVPLGALNADIMDTAFVRSVVPVSKAHRFGDSVELGVSWGYKYLLDLDGMGYSGRFMAFLASDSVPVKATVYDEFFSEWIEPWVHYIPLSAAYMEIYNVVSYFSGPPPAALRAANLSSDVAFRGSPYNPPSIFSQDGPIRRDVGSKSPLEHKNSSQTAPLLGAAQEEGDRRLRRIARAGKNWKQTIGRTVDMEVYVYRLALEYARLWADDRNAMSYNA
ncbi:hypothetical protein B0H16DRAFT_1665594 [Mycena metata]|uniref:Glycosyl transferase CAP10 domain-containing protein n=1 Tax=Mycena metata TaxID=1033252 RepID=A0AAD7HTC6_9AGAR|nr:hypothetical protein B0H16DRAFT_1665594 [Mycena metata]